MFLLLPLAAGLAIALQNVFFEKISRNIGISGTVVIVHFFGLLVGIFVYLLSKGTFSNLSENFSIYMIIAGALGVIVVSSMTKSVAVNGVLLTVMLSVIAQMILSKIIGHFGWFGVDINPINWLQVLAICLMITGVFIYQKS
jgi:transporter family-2 protein